MMEVIAGPDLIRIMTTCYKANTPVMLHGRHGIGKSELLVESARMLGIECVVRDLSVMEPPDLVGLPKEVQGRTVYAPPSFLPEGGRGLMVFEEINRCPSYMRAPTLQLLTSRKLNDYELPDGWLPVAAVNDATDGYDVDEMDAALLSRFLHLKVVPEVVTWMTWAKTNRVHDDILQFLSSSPSVFDSPLSNPRSWTYASALLQAWEAQDGKNEDDLAILLSGVLDDTWAHAFLASYRQTTEPLRAVQIMDEYGSWRSAVCSWRESGRLDLLRGSWEKLRRQIQGHRRFKELLGTPSRKANVELFLSDVDAELRADIAEWVRERGLSGLKVGA